VQAILGLDDYPALHPLSRLATTTPGDYYPIDLQTAYNVTPLYGEGLTGAGQTIGIIGFDTFQESDVRAFESHSGLPQAPIQVVNVDGGPDPLNDSEAETTLDLEWSTAIATGASLLFYGFPDGTLQGLYDSIQKATSDNSASVISISLGACEASISGAIPVVESALAVAATQGQSVMVSSGDSGAYECGEPTLSVSYPGSSAYVTSVGGTALTLNADSSYLHESVWGSETECSTPCGGGGGISSVVARPAWQPSAVNPASGRGVPDVALNSDPATGNVIFFDGVFKNSVGGTSIAAPQWAGLIAIADQATGQRLGLINPALYTTVASAEASGSPPYHDVNDGTTNLYYPAKPGWDYATGWGSPNSNNLVHALLCSTSSSSAAAPASSTAGGPFQVFLPIVLQKACGA